MPEEISHKIRKIVEQGWRNHEFNQYVSDLISVRRDLPDYRHDECIGRSSEYRKNLPATSVIVVFHNEAWSTLLRTIHSVLERSPENLVEEIILVDDCSDMSHLRKPLENYIKKFPKVKIERLNSRQGLVRARLRGVGIAKASILTFLDAHVECSPGWLEPLLSRIAEDDTNVVCPIIDIIDSKTFAYKPTSGLKRMMVGSFDWDLNFHWEPISRKERERKKNVTDPTRSPVMAGGLFSISKNFFEKIGKYDPGLDIWGVENLELSFKTWMCGGSLEIIPCSRVGHVFRSKSPYTWRDGVGTLRRNKHRLASVWMDEFAKYFLTRSGRKAIEIGDITERVKLRENLQCKSFRWFMENVNTEMRFPANATAYGEIRHVASGDMCLEARADSSMKVNVGECREQGGSQYFEFEDGYIRREDNVLVYDGKKILAFVNQFIKRKNQLWFYKHDTKNIVHKKSEKCLSLTREMELAMEVCGENIEGQEWDLENLNLSLLSSNE